MARRLRGSDERSMADVLLKLWYVDCTVEICDCKISRYVSKSKRSSIGEDSRPGSTTSKSHIGQNRHAQEV